MTEMALGERRTVAVKSRQKWNELGVRVRAGERLHFAASGKWSDSSIHVDAEGYSSDAEVLGAKRVLFRSVERWRRAPDHRWFALMVALEHDSATSFSVGLTKTWVAPAAGSLAAFANDLPFMYWNNAGEIALSIERIR
jgi:hypothetical protein